LVVFDFCTIVKAPELIMQVSLWSPEQNVLHIMGMTVFVFNNIGKLDNFPLWSHHMIFPVSTVSDWYWKISVSVTSLDDI